MHSFPTTNMASLQRQSPIPRSPYSFDNLESDSESEDIDTTIVCSRRHRYLDVFHEDCENENLVNDNSRIITREPEDGDDQTQVPSRSQTVPTQNFSQSDDHPKPSRIILIKAGSLIVKDLDPTQHWRNGVAGTISGKDDTNEILRESENEDSIPYYQTPNKEQQQQHDVFFQDKYWDLDLYEEEARI